MRKFKVVMITSYFDRNGLNHVGVDKLLAARKLVYDCAQAKN